MLTTTTVRNTSADDSGGFGRGISADYWEMHGHSSLKIERSVSVGNTEMGVGVIFATLVMDRVVISDTDSSPSGFFGRGVAIRGDTSKAVPGSATISNSLLLRNADFGIIVFGTDAVLSNLRVEQTAARPFDGTFGDGVGVIDIEPHDESALQLQQLWIADNFRSGLTNLGSDVSFSDTKLSCNPVQIAAESEYQLPSRPFSFKDLGGNRCGCGEPLGACAAQSTGMPPPEPPPSVFQ